jgi:hypothetical protein
MAQRGEGLWSECLLWAHCSLPTRLVLFALPLGRVMGVFGGVEWPEVSGHSSLSHRPSCWKRWTKSLASALWWRRSLGRGGR